MTDIAVAMVIIARNEEKFIAKAIESVERQTLRPYRTILVNDGSTDSTADVVSGFDWVERVDMPKHESYLARKELACTVNAGLEMLHGDAECRYVCLGSADILYPENYLHVIIPRMVKDPTLAVTSGVIRGEFSTEPRGAGRVVQCEFWRKTGLKYPTNYGYEGYLLFKAASMGYRNSIYGDLIMDTQRRTGSHFEPARYKYYGMAMRALGYRPVYALGKVAAFSTRNPAGAMHMLKGYYAKNVDLYEEDVRKYVAKTQAEAPHQMLKFFRTLRR